MQALRQVLHCRRSAVVPSLHDGFTEALETEVAKAREHIEWRTDYMSLLEKYEIEREEGRAEGLEEGIGIGRQEERATLLSKLLSEGIITPEQAKQFA